MVIGFDVRDIHASGCDSFFTCGPDANRAAIDLYAKYEAMIAEHYGVDVDGNVSLDAGFSCFNSFPLEWMYVERFRGTLFLFAFITDANHYHENDIRHVLMNRIEGVSKNFLLERGFKSLGYDVAGSVMDVSAVHTLSMGPDSDLFRLLGRGTELNTYGLFGDLDVASEAAVISDILAPEHAAFNPVEVLMLHAGE